MLKRQLPAVDWSIDPLNGVSRDGQPLSYNRAPAPDLAPWIARLYVTTVELPSRRRIECGLFNDTACIRIQLAGNWTAQTRDGMRAHGPAALFFGPQSRRMPVSVTGSFASVGISLRPGACHALYGARLSDFVDRLAPIEEFGCSSDKLMSLFSVDESPEDWLQVLEDMFRAELAQFGAVGPDPVTSRFEELSFTNPSASIAEFAEECGIEQRRLERIVRRDFGMAPKQVLRRARALDMASYLRGVADHKEANELALRYYDQSHLIREFSELFGMSPGQFVATPQPVLTLALESRQARRLEAIARIAPGAKMPWQ